tara:strand:- start:5825 stop:6874 length:1050 start_codon:yes stop_codon:yes gene_type:complete
MATIPPAHNSTVEAIYRHYETSHVESSRAHLGASMIGRECNRALWYGFRWATVPNFPGRVLRLFKRGHDEESFFITDLIKSGAQVWSEDATTGKQYGCSFHGGHFAGSSDGVAKGLLESPDEPHLLEFKTHNHKSFALLKKQGVRESKPEHYAQMQVYMHGLDLKHAMYMAVSKDTDELFTEFFDYNQDDALALVEKARNIIATDEPPPGISTRAEFFKCKFCDHQDVCHRGELPQVNCRTCIHAQVDIHQGGWNCVLNDKPISTDEQRLGCEKHLYNHHLVPHQMVDMDAPGNWVRYKTIDGVEFYNSQINGPGHYTSSEIKSAPALLGDPGADSLRAAFNGKFVEDN